MDRTASWMPAGAESVTERIPDGERIAALEALSVVNKSEHAQIVETLEDIRGMVSGVQADINKASGGFRMLILLGGGLAALLTLGKALFPALAVVWHETSTGKPQ